MGVTVATAHIRETDTPLILRFNLRVEEDVATRPGSFTVDAASYTAPAVDIAQGEFHGDEPETRLLPGADDFSRDGVIEALRQFENDEHPRVQAAIRSVLWQLEAPPRT